MTKGIRENTRIHSGVGFCHYGKKMVLQLKGSNEKPYEMYLRMCLSRKKGRHLFTGKRTPPTKTHKHMHTHTLTSRSTLVSASGFLWMLHILVEEKL